MTALAGLTVLDFSRFLPGAYFGWLAGDMGAEVIRIEHPRELAKAQAMFGSSAPEPNIACAALAPATRATSARCC